MAGEKTKLAFHLTFPPNFPIWHFPPCPANFCSLIWNTPIYISFQTFHKRFLNPLLVGSFNMQVASHNMLVQFFCPISSRRSSSSRMTIGSALLCHRTPARRCTFTSYGFGPIHVVISIFIRIHHYIIHYKIVLFFQWPSPR